MTFIRNLSKHILERCRRSENKRIAYTWWIKIYMWIYEYVYMYTYIKRENLAHTKTHLFTITFFLAYMLTIVIVHKRHFNMKFTSKEREQKIVYTTIGKNISQKHSPQLTLGHIMRTPPRRNKSNATQHPKRNMQNSTQKEKCHIMRMPPI